MAKSMLVLSVFILATITSVLGSSCCPNIVLQSSGNLASSNQAHILGNYFLISEDDEGRPIYQQDSSLTRFIFYRSGINVSTFIHLQDLFYKSSSEVDKLGMLQHWYVNDQTGINQGYAFNPGTEECISDSTGIWEYWDGSAWTQDPYTSVSCV